MLRTRVKVGDITDLSDARYCAGMGVEMLGFPVGGSPHSINPEKYHEITNWISVPSFVLEYLRADPKLRATISSYNAQLVSIDASDLPDFPVSGPPVIVRVDASHQPHWEPPEAHAGKIAFVELNGPPSIEINESLVSGLSARFSVLLAYGITPASLEEILALPIAGLSLRGSEELRPGIKDYGLLAEILEKLEIG